VADKEHEPGSGSGADSGQTSTSGQSSRWQLTEKVRSGVSRPEQTEDGGKAGEEFVLRDSDAPKPTQFDVGVLGSIQVRSGKQRAEIQAARQFYRHKLEAFTHQLGGMVRVAKKKTDLNVATALAQIDAEYLEQLQKLDIENYDTRASLQQELLRRTARQLAQAEEQDAPDFLKEQLIKSIVRQHEQAMEKIGGAGAVSLEEA